MDLNWCVALERVTLVGQPPIRLNSRDRFALCATYKSEHILSMSVRKS